MIINAWKRLKLKIYSLLSICISLNLGVWQIETHRVTICDAIIAIILFRMNREPFNYKTPVRCQNRWNPIFAIQYFFWQQWQDPSESRVSLDHFCWKDKYCRARQHKHIWWFQGPWFNQGHSNESGQPLSTNRANKFNIDTLRQPLSS